MLILFDIDDTLLDHEATERSAATLLYKRISTPAPIEEFLVRWSAALERHFARYIAGEVSYQGQRRDRLREVVGASLSDEGADRLFAGYLSSYEASWSLFSDVLPCLDGLSQHCLGVISSGQGDQQRRKLAQTGIGDRFECILISEECGCAKPDATIFLRACALLGERPGNSVYVGDRYERDAQAARTAGLQGVWLDRKGRAMAGHAPPIIRTLDGLRALLEAGEA